MPALIVANRTKEWPLPIPNVEIVDAWRYLTKPEFSARRNVRLYNLCGSYTYQSTGYYVSLLAEARGPVREELRAAGLEEHFGPIRENATIAPMLRQDPVSAHF